MTVSSDPISASPNEGRRTLLERVPIQDWLRSRALALFDRHGSQARGILTRVGWRRVLLEWLVISLIVLTYCSGFLDLGTQRMLPGPESENFQGPDWVLRTSLAHYGQVPLWNPYLRSGVPMFGDPFIHLLNPLSTLPVLLLGVMDGFKVGLFLSFVAAGIGMWWLAAVLGIASPVRVWMALMYAFTGQPVARFFQGEYDFTLGFAWIPWILGSTIAAVHTRRPLYVAMAGVSMALLFFSGNSQYTFYLPFVMVLFGLVVLFRRCTSRICVDWGAVRVLVAVGVLALGLAAIQLLPLLEFHPRIGKATDPTGYGSQNIQQILLNYISNDTDRPDAWEVKPDGSRIPKVPREEYYAYTGIWPFAALLLLPLAFWRTNHRKAIVFLCLLLGLVVAFIDVRGMPWRDLYAQHYLLHQFRHHQRILIYGACALIVLAGLGINVLWGILRDRARSAGESPLGLARRFAPLLGLALLAGFMLSSTADVYATNRQHAQTRAPSPHINGVLEWLRAHDPSEYYVSYPGDWQVAMFSNRHRYHDAHYGFGDIRWLQGMENRRSVQARPNYRVLANDRRSDDPGAVEVRRFEQHTVYRLPHSLPFAFAVEKDRLLNPAAGQELRSGDVTPLPLFMPGPNGMEVIAHGQAGSTLVVLATHYPGWEVAVSGRRQDLKNVGGYLATDLLPGVHKYVFTFSPTSFYVGLAISLLSLLVALGLVLGDLRVDWRSLPSRIRGFRPSLDWPPRVPVLRPLLEGIACSRRRRGDSQGSKEATLEAVYQNGALRFTEPLDLPSGSRLRVVLGSGGALVLSEPPGGAGVLWRMGIWLGRLVPVLSLEWALFGMATLVYGVTRLFALDQFPIYFFCDEATQALLGQELLDRGFRDAQGGWFPIFFEPAPQRWVPMVSVYFHSATVALFGKSIIATRATSAVVSFFAVLAVALILKLVFRARFWWAGALVMAMIPAWFIHSRTAFEWPTMIAFYAGFLLFYLLYRTRSPRYLFAAVPLGAAAFYTYNTQAMVAATALLLFLSDIRYHIRNWRTVSLALLLAAVLAIPLIGYRIHHPTAVEDQLRVIGSYWFQSISLQEKLARFGETYLAGLNPQYWFFPHNHDLPRHLLKGYGHIRTELLPLWLLGVGLCLWRVRSAPHRAILLATLAVPAAAAMAAVGIGRVLVFVVPASILMVLGLELLLGRLPRRVPYGLVAGLVLAALSLSSLSMLRQALTEGPTWYRDYGLYGMQYGARQLFEEAIPAYLRRDPNVRVLVSPVWANGTDSLQRFFASRGQQRVHLGTVGSYMANRQPLDSNMVFVMTDPEYRQAQASGKFKSISIEQTIPYPDGSPGFHFARLAYADQVDTILAAEREARRQLVEARLPIGGQSVLVRHSRLDMGDAGKMFDGDPHSLARGMEANPFVVEMVFPEPRAVQGLVAVLGSMDFELTVRLFAPDRDQPVSQSAVYRRLPPDPRVEMEFADSPERVARLRIEIKNLQAGETSNIHVRELTLR